MSIALLTARFRSITQLAPLGLLAFQVGCAAAPDDLPNDPAFDPSDEAAAVIGAAGGSADALRAEGDAPASDVGDDAEAVDSNGQALTGTTVADSSCLQNEANLATWAVEAGRFVAVSQGFYECVADAFAGTVSLLHDGSTVNAGPYNVYPGDPFATNSASYRGTMARIVADAPTPLSLKCGGTSSESNGVIAYAGIGTYNEQRETAETITAAAGWRTLAANDGGQPASTATVGQFYQSTRRRAANAIWHEVMHQWGYGHAGGAWKQSFENTAPYIVGDCMEKVMRRSADCTTVCGAKQRPVMNFRDSSCSCYSDPQYDVGVLLPASADNGLNSESCSFMGSEFRFQPNSTATYWMDTEDDGTDDSSQSGWSSSMHVSPGGKGNVWIQACRVPGVSFKAKRLAAGATSAQLLAANYAVIRLGASCPPGSVAAARLFDNEDDSNGNSTSDYAAPSKVAKNLRLELCVFQGTTSATNSATSPFPIFDQDLLSAVDSMSYGVYAGTAFPGALATGAVFSDDEDTNNSNQIYGVSSATTPFIESTGAGNTRMRIVRAR